MDTNSSVHVSKTPEVDANDIEVPIWAQVFVVLFMSAVTLIGVPGNGIILIVQWKNRDKSSTDVLVSTMAAFECVCAGFNSVLVILKSIPALWIAIASSAICSVHSYTQYTASISSTLLLTAIALDRYLQTCKPLNTFYSKAKAYWICSGIITISLLVSLPGLLMRKLDQTQLTCKRKQDSTALLYLDLCLGAAFFIMFIVVVFCYSKVAVLIQRRHRQKVRSRFTQASTSMPLTNTTQLSLTSPKGNVSYLKKNKIHPQTSKPVSVIENNSLHGHLQNVPPDTHRETSTTPHQQNGQHAVQIQEAKQVNRTTLIMFLITTIYIVSWVLHWLFNAFVSLATIEGLTAVYLTRYLYMISCVMNPIFFISLSSKFRQKARMYFCRH